MKTSLTHPQTHVLFASLTLKTGSHSAFNIKTIMYVIMYITKYVIL